MSNAREAYLEAQVMTATPQKLRLMLIEGAAHFARQTLQHWEHERNQEGFETLVRCREIVTELLAAVKPDDSQLSKRVTALYVYLFQSLTTAQARRDRKMLEGVIQVLEEERATWRQVCEQMPAAPQRPLGQPAAVEEITASNIPAIPPLATGESAHSPGGFTLDA